MNSLSRKSALLLAAALAFCASLAYAASSYQVNHGATVQVNEHGVCQNVYNATGQSLFVPTNSSDEWSYFRTYKPGSVSLSPCYSYSWQVGGWGGCSVSCGVGTQYRSVWCQRNDGATVDNAYCGGGMPSGSQACDMGSCCAWNEGQGCTSAPNNCGATNSGAVQCDGSCGASPPADAPVVQVCGEWYCANSEEVCDVCTDGYEWYECNCRQECSDYERNCTNEPNCSQPPTPGTWQLTGTANQGGPTGCHYEEECTDTVGYANAFRNGQSCSAVGTQVTCWWNDSASGCGGGKVQGLFRTRYSYTCQ